jgi:hypothetical protein
MLHLGKRVMDIQGEEALAYEDGNWFSKWAKSCCQPWIVQCGGYVGSYLIDSFASNGAFINQVKPSMWCLYVISLQKWKCVKVTYMSCILTSKIVLCFPNFFHLIVLQKLEALGFLWCVHYGPFYQDWPFHSWDELLSYLVQTSQLVWWDYSSRN